MNIFGYFAHRTRRHGFCARIAGPQLGTAGGTPQRLAGARARMSAVPVGSCEPARLNNRVVIPLIICPLMCAYVHMLHCIYFL